MPSSSRHRKAGACWSTAGRTLIVSSSRSTRGVPPWDRRIDLVILTHPHEDHVGGLPLLLERYRVGRLFEPGMTGPGPAYAALETALALRGMHSAPLSTGDRFDLDGVSFRVLWPDQGSVPRAPPDTGTGINNVSIVLLGSVGSQHFLLTGDIEEEVDPVLVARGLPHVDVLKVAHHGSRTATTDALLNAIDPTVGRDLGRGEEQLRAPRAGDPRPARAHGVATYRTDLDGTLDVALDGHSISVRTGRTRAPGERGPGAGRRARPDLGGRCLVGRRRPDRRGRAPGRSSDTGTRRGSGGGHVSSDRCPFPGAPPPPLSSCRSSHRPGTFATCGQWRRLPPGSRSARPPRAIPSTGRSWSPRPSCTTSTRCSRRAIRSGRSPTAREARPGSRPAATPSSRPP